MAARRTAAKPATTKTEETNVEASGQVAAPAAPPEEAATKVTEESEKFYVTKRDYFGAQLVDIAKQGWVGPAPLTIAVDEIDDLIKGLRAIKKD